MNEEFPKFESLGEGTPADSFVYRASAAFPRQELYGITSQMRRASSSIAGNIAEGYGRGGDGEFRHFLNTAAGSAVEVEYFALLAKDLDMVTSERYQELQGQIVEVQRMISGLLRTVSKTRTEKHSTTATGSGLEARS